jgi:protein involved in polysaccharide export with SLBB domain
VGCVKFPLVVGLVLLIPAVAFAYTLGPGDQLDIEVRTEQSLLSLQMQVSIDGRIYIAPAGAFVAQGKSPQQMEAEIAKTMSRYYTGKVEVAVLVAQPKQFPVSVLGQVHQPGDLRIPDDRPLLSTAVMKAGGVLSQAGTRRVSLVRDGREMGPIDLYAILNLGRSEQDVLLRPNDIIYVPARERWATVTGPVETPGVYELLAGDRVSNLIRMAGGLTALADPRRAVIERPEGTEGSRIIKVDLQAALAHPGGDADAPLEHGDTIRLAGRIAQVYVVGEVTQPGPQDFQDNRSVMDYIGLAGGLTKRAVGDRAGIVRPGNPQPKVLRLDLGALMQGRSKDPPPTVEPGDIIVVPEHRIATIQDWGSIGQVLTGIFAGIRLF